MWNDSNAGATRFLMKGLQRTEKVNERQNSDDENILIFFNDNTAFSYSQGFLRWFMTDFSFTDNLFFGHANIFDTWKIIFHILFVSYFLEIEKIHFNAIIMMKEVS